MMNNDIFKIYDCRADGLCESCSCGFDNCIKAGKAKCLDKEDDYVEETSV